jgi:hypothetical protein
MQPSDYRAIPDLFVKLFGQVSVEFLSCPMTLISQIRVLNKLNISCTLIRSDLSRTTRPGALYESVYTACVKPINPPGKVAPSRVIKLGYLIMTDTQEQSLDRHHPNVAPEADSSPSSSIQLCQ